MSIKLAVKPKYPNRKAVDKVLYNEGNQLTMIDSYVSKHILDMLGTSFVAIDHEGAYYPVDIETYKEQYELVESGEAPTVEADDNFGIKKLENFVALSESEVCAQIQNINIYNGIISGKVYKVLKYEDLSDEKIDKNGFWMIFDFDMSSAEAEGYSDLVFADGTEVADGDNYIFLGNTDEDIHKAIVMISGKLTQEEVEEEVSMAIEMRITPVVWIEKDAEPAISIDGREYPTLIAAIAALGDKSGKIVVTKSIEEAAEVIALNKGTDITIEIQNDAVISLGKYIEVSTGNLYVIGKGTIQETTPNMSPIILTNLDENINVEVDIAKDITLTGWAGLFFNKASYNLNAVVHGKCVGQNDGSDNGAGIYINGQVKSGSLFFTGSTEGTAGFGIFQSGNINSTIIGAVVDGSDGAFEIRSGSTVIENSKVVTSTTDEPGMTPSGSGTTSTGCAMAVAQHINKNPVSILIRNGCTFSGPAAFMEGNPQQNPDATTDTSIRITDGSVFIGKIKTLTPADDCKNFLYGSKYTEEPAADYIAAGFEAQEQPNGSFIIVSK